MNNFILSCRLTSLRKYSDQAMFFRVSYASWICLLIAAPIFLKQRLIRNIKEMSLVHFWSWSRELRSSLMLQMYFFSNFQQLEFKLGNHYTQQKWKADTRWLLIILRKYFVSFLPDLNMNIDTEETRNIKEMSLVHFWSWSRELRSSLMLQMYFFSNFQQLEFKLGNHYTQQKWKADTRWLLF